MKECPVCRRCFSDEVNHCPQDGDATTPSLLGEPVLDARYQLERRLGQGGMGVVFQARHIFLKTSHAIKVILPDLVGNDPMLVTRFRQEALAAAAIRHPNIIAVTDFGVVRGTMPFLVMEFVNGNSLQDLLAEEKVMPPERALEIACAIGAGVGAAHRQGIVHRDLKPLNIMIQKGQPVAEGLKILDFGLAKIKSSELLGSFVQAKTSGMMGSPFYMAPEQWSDDEPDARADIYSLGIILYQMLSGDVPFKGTSIPSIMKKHLTLPPPSFKSAGVEISARLEAVVRHALEKEISARTASVEDFLQELRAAVAAGGAPELGGETFACLPDETMYAPAPTTTEGVTSSTALRGVSSSPSLTAEQLEQLEISRAAQEREQQEKERLATEARAREAEERRKAEEERERQRLEQEERIKKEREEREERERQQREQMERVERQAKELEERLARLATSMPPVAQTAVESASMPPMMPLPTTAPGVGAASVHPNIARPSIGDNSFPGTNAAATVYESFPPAAATTIPPTKKRTPLFLIGGLVLLVLLIGGGIGLFLLLGSKATVTPDPSPGPDPNPPVINKLQVEIPGGTFQMGRNAGPPQERPEHTVTVKDFFMDRTEVTNSEYADFVQETGHEAPPDWVRGKPLAGQEQWPVANVSGEDALAFADWRSKRDGVVYRLPDEEEWEYAARNGGEFQSFPWGNSFDEKLAVVKGATPKPVGSKPEGQNKWGVMDLIGNVSEWTSSKASIYSGLQIPAENRDWLVLRGGSYASDPNDPQIPVSATYRDWFKPSLRHPTFGFRLARDGR